MQCRPPVCPRINNSWGGMRSLSDWATSPRVVVNILLSNIWCIATHIPLLTREHHHYQISRETKLNRTPTVIHLVIKSKGFSLQGSQGDCEYAGSQLFENRRPSPSRNSNMQRVSRVSGQMPTHLLGLSSFYNSYYYLSIVKFLPLLLLLVYMSSFYNWYYYLSTCPASTIAIYYYLSSYYITHLFLQLPANFYFCL